MSEKVPLLPSTTSGRSRRLRTSAIGLQLALCLVASLLVTRMPSVLESDGEHDGMLIVSAIC
jgi:hypothetical protein